MPRQRRFRGHAPDGGRLLAENEKWALYAFGPDRGDWMSVKLVAKGRAPSKANYRFGWGRVAQRLARSRDAALLAAHRPDVYAWVERVLSDEEEPVS